MDLEKAHIGILNIPKSIPRLRVVTPVVPIVISDPRTKGQTLPRTHQDALGDRTESVLDNIIFNLPHDSAIRVINLERHLNLFFVDGARKSFLKCPSCLDHILIAKFERVVSLGVGCEDPGTVDSDVLIWLVNYSVPAVTTDVPSIRAGVSEPSKEFEGLSSILTAQHGYSVTQCTHSHYLRVLVDAELMRLLFCIYLHPIANQDKFSEIELRQGLKKTVLEGVRDFHTEGGKVRGLCLIICQVQGYSESQVGYEILLVQTLVARLIFLPILLLGYWL